MVLVLPHFQGSLNGSDSSNGTHYRISNLSINSSSQYQGLFGYTRNAEFNQVELDNVTIHSTSNHVGALIGYADNTSLQSNYAQIDNITGGSYVGGLVGEITNSVITSGGF